MSKADRRNPYDRKSGKKPRFRFFKRSKKRPPASMNFGQLNARGVKLAPHGDVDRDGVPNAADCRPLDPEKHALKLTDSDVSGGERVGWVVRSYNPRAFAEHGTGVEHEKTFRHLEDVKGYIRDEEGGELSSSAEASNAPRVYVQEIYRMGNGSIRRRHIDTNRLV